MNEQAYCLIDDYVYPDDVNDWLNCPNCGLKPKVWLFNNGRSTGCGCGSSKYNHFSIHAESINSCFKNKTQYDGNALKNNWNHFVKTGEILFKHAGLRTDGRW